MKEVDPNNYAVALLTDAKTGFDGSVKNWRSDKTQYWSLIRDLKCHIYTD